MSISYVNPDGVSAPLGLYSNVARAPGGLLFVAGQLSVDETGAIVDGPMARQLRQVYTNVQRLLASEELTLDDVCQFTTYVVGDSAIDAFYAARADLFAEIFPEGRYPPNTLLVVSRLVRPEFCVEVQTIACRP